MLRYLGSPKVTVGVTAVIPDTEGRILLVRHTYRRPAWGLPSGLARRGELAAVALRRELREELGLTATVVEPQLHSDHEPGRHLITLYYRVVVEGTPHYSVEIDDHRYASLEELPELLGWQAPPWMQAAVTAHRTGCQSREEGA
jgi:8-oxo-dGTP pyrophosphatase MutT (NUDIX family)